MDPTATPVLQEAVSPTVSTSLMDILNAAPAEAVAEPAAVAPPLEEPGAAASVVAVDELPPPPESVFKPVVKPPVTPPAEEAIPADVSRGGQKAIGEWKRRKLVEKEQTHKIEELTKALRDREAELSTLKSVKPAMAPEEIEQLRKRSAELEDQIGRIDITRSREFQQKFDIPQTQLRQRAEGLLVRAGKTPDEAKALAEAVFKPGKSLQDIQELVYQEPPVIQGALVNLLTEHQTLEEGRTQHVNNWRESQAALREEAARRDEASANQAISQFTEAAVTELQEEGSWLFKDDPSNEVWTKARQARLDVVRGIMKTGSPKDFAKFIAEGVAAQTYRQMYERERAQRLQFEEEVKTTMGLRPGVRGNNSVVETPAVPPKSRNPGQFLGEIL